MKKYEFNTPRGAKVSFMAGDVVYKDEINLDGHRTGSITGTVMLEVKDIVINGQKVIGGSFYNNYANVENALVCKLGGNTVVIEIQKTMWDEIHAGEKARSEEKMKKLQSREEMHHKYIADYNAVRSAMKE